jgi:hypothetical protein
MQGSKSPSGRFEITIAAWEARMSLWIETPTLSDRLTGQDLFSFKDPNWSLDSAEWLSDSIVALKMRKYPGNHLPAHVVVTVDCLAGTADIGGTTVPSINDLERHLESALTWNYSAPPQTGSSHNSVVKLLERVFGRIPDVPRGMPSAQAPVAAPSIPRSILVTLLGWLAIAVGALGTPISAITLLMLQSHTQGTSTDDPLGFLVIVLAPPAAIAAGIGLLRRKQWARYSMLGLLLWALAHNVYVLARGPIPETSYVSPAGVPTTILATPASPLTIPIILLCAWLIVTLLSRKVRAEF